MRARAYPHQHIGERQPAKDQEQRQEPLQEHGWICARRLASRTAAGLELDDFGVRGCAPKADSAVFRILGVFHGSMRR